MTESSGRVCTKKRARDLSPRGFVGPRYAVAQSRMTIIMQIEISCQIHYYSTFLNFLALKCNTNIYYKMPCVFVPDKTPTNNSARSCCI